MLRSRPCARNGRSAASTHDGADEVIAEKRGLCSSTSAIPFRSRFPGWGTAASPRSPDEARTPAPGHRLSWSSCPSIRRSASNGLERLVNEPHGCKEVRVVKTHHPCGDAQDRVEFDPAVPLHGSSIPNLEYIDWGLRRGNHSSSVCPSVRRRCIKLRRLSHAFKAREASTSPSPCHAAARGVARAGLRLSLPVRAHNRTVIFSAEAISGPRFRKRCATVARFLRCEVVRTMSR